MIIIKPINKMPFYLIKEYCPLITILKFYQYKVCLYPWKYSINNKISDNRWVQIKNIALNLIVVIF
jgi:hypothetical protein